MGDERYSRNEALFGPDGQERIVATKVTIIGLGCLVCRSVLDQQEMRRDSMSPEQREVHDRIYGVKRGALGDTGPMVVSVNGVVASLAVTEFMVFVTGMREPVPHLVYRGDRATV